MNKKKKFKQANKQVGRLLVNDLAKNKNHQQKRMQMTTWKGFVNCQHLFQKISEHQA